MSVRRLADQQPDSFAFTPENEEKCAEILAKYPDRPAGLGGDRASVAGAKAK